MTGIKLSTNNCVFLGIFVFCVFLYIGFENSHEFISLSPPFVPTASPIVWDIKQDAKYGKIQIVIVLTRNVNLDEFATALASITCYSAIHNYKYRLVYDDEYKMCTQKDLFFRRHCVISELLKDADYTLFLDADIGVVNPSRKIEEFIDAKFDLVFYDRFYDQEIAAGSYIAKNSDRARKILRDFADYESKLPNSYTGTDNGAIHIYLATILFPKFASELNDCSTMYNNSRDADDMFAYIACIKTLFGANQDFGFVKLFQKGTGWVRDAWLTNGKWNRNQDFMLHGWKKIHLKTYTKEELPISPISPIISGWFNPFVGEFSAFQCKPRQSAWLYDMNLHASEEEIVTRLRNYYKEVEKKRWKFLARFSYRMNYY